MLLTNILKNINFLVLRGYENLHIKLPLYPDDIDILTDDYDKIFNCIKPYLIRIDNPKVGHILNIDNKQIKLDIRVIGYNYYDSNWETKMLKNKTLYNNFYILDKLNYKWSILYHCLIHKKDISKKYYDFIKLEFNTLNKDKLYLLLEKYMSINNYKFIKPKDKNCFYYNYKATKMLFLIRKKGLQRHPNCIEEMRKNLEENNYKINNEGFITIKNNEKFLTNFYKNKMNDENIKKTILDANDNQCYIFITDYNNYKKKSLEIKNILRKKYPNPDNIHWNYFHSSDNVEEAYQEIDIIFSNKTNFKGIGTYYSQKII